MSFVACVYENHRAKKTFCNARGRYQEIRPISSQSNCLFRRCHATISKTTCDADYDTLQGVLTFESVNKILKCEHSNKATEYYFSFSFFNCALLGKDCAKWFCVLSRWMKLNPFF